MDKDYSCQNNDNLLNNSFEIEKLLELEEQFTENTTSYLNQEDAKLTPSSLQKQNIEVFGILKK